MCLGPNLGPLAEFGARGEMDSGTSERKFTVSVLVPHKLNWHGGEDTPQIAARAASEEGTLARGQAGWQPSRVSESGARVAGLGVSTWGALPRSLTELEASERGVQGQRGSPLVFPAGALEMGLFRALHDGHTRL